MTSFEYSKKHYIDNPDYYKNKADRERIKIVLKMIGSHKKVLDIACYNGYIAQEIKKNSNSVYGLDANTEAISESILKGISAKVANIELSLPFQDQSFDLVFAGEIIEHIVDTDFFMNEINRILKPNGELIVTTPNVASLDRRLMLLFNINPFFPASFEFPVSAQSGHLRFFNKRLLIDFLDHKGFKIIGFKSDVISFPFGIYSRVLAKIFPDFGFSIILKCNKKERN